jgi:thiol:disulfide interchange protein DsbD
MDQFMRFNKIIFFLCLSILPFSSQAINPEDLLRPEQAFKISAKAISDQEIIVTFDIAEDYYLYRDKMDFTSKTPGITLDKAILPPGKSKYDEFFGEVVTYRHTVKIPVPVINNNHSGPFQLLVKHQGCADVGICYPPQQTVLTVTLPTAGASKNDPVQQLLQSPSGISLSAFENKLLPADQAFQFFPSVKDGNTLILKWNIADGYYLYREKFQVEIVKSDDIQLENFQIPHGIPEHDEAFGPVEIFYKEVGFEVPLLRTSKTPQNLTLAVKYQGCASRGVCYPPIQKTVELALPASVQTAASTAITSPSQAPLSEQDQIVNALHQDTLWLTLLSFLGFGLLLAFTPCIFPMIPILSGIIVGQGKQITTRKAFLLSLCYVTASALTYTVLGILAASFGSNLQATFQQPWIIVLFSTIFILLAFSMFGFYNLELPKSLQSKLHNSSDKHRDGSFIGAAIMGALSSLIVGPCVAAPLAGALIYIGQTGDAILGGSALFALGFGMGIPLLLMGASAGKLLPKAGAWMNSTKAVFGVIMLAVSAWMLDRILPGPIMMLIWSMLLIIPAIYLSAIDALPENASGWQKLFKGVGVIMLSYGIILLIGLSIGNTNPLKPLAHIGGINNNIEHKLSFKRIASIEELDIHLEQAKNNNQWVMLDFYADWCISCKEMEAYTFSDPQVLKKLEKVVLLQADVTANNETDKALLQRFNLIGPPGIIFFDPNNEGNEMQIIGYQDANKFLSLLNQAGI